MRWHGAAEGVIPSSLDLLHCMLIWTFVPWKSTATKTTLSFYHFAIHYVIGCGAGRWLAYSLNNNCYLETFVYGVEPVLFMNGLNVGVCMPARYIIYGHFNIKNNHLVCLFEHEAPLGFWCVLSFIYDYSVCGAKAIIIWIYEYRDY